MGRVKNSGKGGRMIAAISLILILSTWIMAARTNVGRRLSVLTMNALGVLCFIFIMASSITWAMHNVLTTIRD